MIRLLGSLGDLPILRVCQTLAVLGYVMSGLVQDPSYYVISGLVFTAASEPYLLSEFGSDFMSMAPVNLLQMVYYERAKTKDEQVVLISQVLASDATLGYEDTSNAQVRPCCNCALSNAQAHSSSASRTATLGCYDTRHAQERSSSACSNAQVCPLVLASDATLAYEDTSNAQVCMQHLLQ